MINAIAKLTVKPGMAGEFETVPDYPFKPDYIDVDDFESGKRRMHYVGEGQRTRGP